MFSSLRLERTRPQRRGCPLCALCGPEEEDEEEEVGIEEQRRNNNNAAWSSVGRAPVSGVLLLSWLVWYGRHFVWSNRTGSRTGSRIRCSSRNSNDNKKKATITRRVEAAGNLGQAAAAGGGGG
ncbi:unnamed protein product [Calypogeia fissa]